MVAVELELREGMDFEITKWIFCLFLTLNKF